MISSILGVAYAESLALALEYDVAGDQVQVQYDLDLQPKHTATESGHIRVPP